MQNSQVVARFYEAFGQLDYAQMNALYAPNIIYNDPVTGILKGVEVNKHWEMICRNTKDMSLQCNDIEELDHEYITCTWDATYFFTPLDKKVHYRAKAFMKLNNGIITEHSDGYRFSTWLADAYGLTGTLFGWTGYMKRRVQNKYRRLLNQYLQEL